MNDQELADLRKTYAQRTLTEADVLPAAVPQFRRWLDEALAAKLDEPTAMTVSTVGPDGQPAARVVLLKGLPDDAGFLFYSNYASRKGHELAAQPRAALTFFWPGLERQVRVEGTVEKAPRLCRPSISRAGRAAASSVPGPRPRARSLRAARRWSSARRR